MGSRSNEPSLDDASTSAPPSGQHPYRALAEAMPALVLTTSADGEVEYCNDVLRAYCGVTLDDLKGARWVELIHPDDVNEGRDRWLAEIEKTHSFSSEYRIRRHDGVYRWHHTQTAPLRDDDGPVSGWVAVSVDVHDRREAEDDMRMMSEELLRAMAAKDDFLSLVSHELRTPVTTIYGNAQVLRRRAGQIPLEQVTEAIYDIEQEAIRLQQLIDNMFVLASLDENDRSDTEPVSLHRIAERAAEEHAARFPNAKVSVIDETGHTPVCGHGDYILHTLRNLLTNAEAYGSGRGDIEVLIKGPRDGHLTVHVCDRGPGFGDDAARAFDMFYRSPVTSVRIRGAGIGLAVARRLVEAQGGEIWAGDRPDGGGDVAFTLPVETEERS
jgi:PAS domain S-box-containing protein